MSGGYAQTLGDILEIAANKAGIDGWKGYKWQHAEPNDSIVHGCVPAGLYTRGKRKGQVKWNPKKPGTDRTVVVSAAEIDARAAAYEAAEDKCWNCKGTGQQWAGWSVDEGTKHRTCRRCDGTGKPPA